MALSKIPSLVKSGLGQTGDYLQDKVFENDHLRSVIRLDWNGLDKKWVVTAFEKI